MVRAGVGLLVLMLTACVDYDDASRLVDVKVQVAPPAEYMAGATVGQQTVTIRNSIGTERTATTDDGGLATFGDCMPDVYDISVSWELTNAEYEQKTGYEGSGNGYVVTASASGQVLTDAQEATPVPLAATIKMKSPLVISKIYSSGSKSYADLGGKNYLAGRYFEIYNNSSVAVDVAGLYIGLLDSTSPIPWTIANLEADPDIQGSAVVVKQVLRIPTDTPYMLEGGASLVLTNSAVDHSMMSDYEQDLSTADFECVGLNDRLEHNPSVPKLEMVYACSSGLTTMNLVQGGPCGIIIFTTDDDPTQWPKTYGYGKTSGSQTYLLVPKAVIQDGVDFLKNRTTDGPDITLKRLYTDIDANCTHIDALSGYSGEVLYRKTLRTATDGRRTLKDTNNSANDFQISTTIKVREYDAN